MPNLTKLITPTLIFVFFSIQAQDNVGIGTTSPDPSALLDLTDTTKGILIPRTNDTNYITAPAEGLMIYLNNTQSFWYFDGIKWVQVGNSSSSSSSGGIDTTDWNLLGNVGTDENIHFVGTIDSVNLTFRTHNIERLRINQSRLEWLNSGGSIFIGKEAGKNDDLSFKQNIFIGNNAGTNNTTGFECVAIGASALNQNIDTRGHTAVGFSALKDNTTGIYNTGIGWQSLMSNVDGRNNTAVGFGSIQSNVSGIDNTAIGGQTLNENIDGDDNTAVGWRALRYSTVAKQNTAVGSGALEHTEGSKNTVVGYEALRMNVGGEENVVVGHDAGRGSVAGDKSGNTLLGYKAGFQLEDGDRNIFLGYNAGYFETGDNKLYIENSDADESEALIYGEFDNDKVRINGTLEINDVLELEPRSSAPSSPKAGMLYFDSGDDELKYYNGSSWVSLD